MTEYDKRCCCLREIQQTEEKYTDTLGSIQQVRRSDLAPARRMRRVERQRPPHAGLGMFPVLPAPYVFVSHSLWSPRCCSLLPPLFDFLSFCVSLSLSPSFPVSSFVHLSLLLSLTFYFLFFLWPSLALGFFFFFFLLHYVACEISVPWIRDLTHAPCSGSMES